MAQSVNAMFQVKVQGRLYLSDNSSASCFSAKYQEILGSTPVPESLRNFKTLSSAAV